MPMEALEAPPCTHQEKGEEPCGKTMFRIGTTEHWAWVCKECDGVDPKQSMDA